MEILPDDAVVLIFEFLDNDSMYNAMKVCQRWVEFMLIQEIQGFFVDGSMSLRPHVHY